MGGLGGGVVVVGAVCKSVCSILSLFFNTIFDTIFNTIICSCWLCVALRVSWNTFSCIIFLHGISWIFLDLLKGDSVRPLTLWLCDSGPFPIQITVYYCWRSYLVSLFYYPLISCSHCHQLQLQNRRREGLPDETDIITLCECKWVYVVR